MASLFLGKIDPAIVLVLIYNHCNPNILKYINLEDATFCNRGEKTSGIVLILIKYLESIQHSIFKLKYNKKAKNVLKILKNLGCIYRFLIEDIHKKRIFVPETIRERMISFTEKTMKFIQEFRINLHNEMILMATTILLLQIHYKNP